MKKIAMICAAVAAVVLLSSANKKDDKVMVKENGAYVINTTELGKGVDGYVGPTPLKVYIRKNKIEKIEFKPFSAPDTEVYQEWTNDNVPEYGRLKLRLTMKGDTKIYLFTKNIVR